MLNILSYKGNANQNHIEISSDSSQNGYYQEHKQQQNVDEGVSKNELIYFRNVNLYNHCGKQYAGSSKTKAGTTI
jgi:hypothetical protein